VVELVDEADLGAAQRSAGFVVQLQAIDAIQKDGARLRPFQQAGSVQQGGLAGA
jgi:hypothetical protein